jgi:hypothetical protein
MDDKVFGIFSGEYSDWQVHGYLNTEDEAEKYCALKNKGLDFDKYYYYKELPLIKADVSNVKINYYHCVVFDFEYGMRNDPDGYEYYTGEPKKPQTIYNLFRDNQGWISFQFNCETREKAEKIAQDKYAEFLNYYHETGSYKKAAELIGAKEF